MKMMKLSALLLGLFLSTQTLAADPWAQSYYHEARGEYVSAAAVLAPLMESGPTDEFLLLRFAWLTYLQGNFSESLNYYQKALTANPLSIDARLGMTLPLIAQKRWNTAEQQLRNVIDQNNWHYTAHTRLMEVEQGLQKWDTLLKHTKEFVRRYPSDATGLVYQARAYRWLNDPKGAREAYRKVLQRFPDHYEANQYLAALK